MVFRFLQNGRRGGIPSVRQIVNVQLRNLIFRDINRCIIPIVRVGVIGWRRRCTIPGFRWS
ncbi:MAG: hypothetical protein A9Z00_12815 [Thermobacillus sp. ZCTH02-B1]|nr:MAG: hypothetical protein A9Z00_12815 [Thermobacillus sp. ZCTH02-B1]